MDRETHDAGRDGRASGEPPGDDPGEPPCPDGRVRRCRAIEAPLRDLLSPTLLEPIPERMRRLLR